MRIAVLIVLGLMLATTRARADEQLPVLQVGGEVYSNVTITSVTPTDIYFTHANGMGSAKLRDLDPALQKHFNYDAARAQAANPTPDPSNPKAVLDDAMARVRAIVNQPVTQLPANAERLVSIYSPGWFHPGAITPDFDTVDVRKTQDLQYAAHEFVSSDLNPDVCFLGRELEFNSMTKFFYTDRTLPKKKLTEAEMLEINRLYRIIGDCERRINNPEAASPQGGNSANQPPDAGTASNSSRGFLATHLNVIATAAGALFLVIMAILYIRKSRSES